MTGAAASPRRRRCRSLVSAQPRDIILLSQEMLLERVYGDKPHEGPSVRGLYDDKMQTVWCPHECRAEDLLDQSTLLHELVHHLQTVTGMVYPCPPARERLAYGLEAQQCLGGLEKAS